MYLNLVVYAVVFGIFYTLLFLLLNKSKALKITFTAMFFFTTIMYFILTLLLWKYVKL